MKKDVMKDNVSIVFGDSITYGLYDKEYCGWVNRVRIILEKNANNNFIVNLGIPGQNSSNILNRFENELKERFNDIDNFNLIFSFGIKDSLLLNNDNDYLKVFEDNVLRIIEISKKYTDKIYFIGLLKIDSNKRQEYMIDNVFKIDDLIEKICINYDIKYIKIRDLIQDDDLDDGLHPNNNGHKKISEIVLKEIFNIE